MLLISLLFVRISWYLDEILPTKSEIKLAISGHEYSKNLHSSKMFLVYLKQINN